MDEGDTDLKLLLERGKAQMDDKLYPDALGSIMKSINLCPCKPSSHGRDKSCNISQCISAVRKSESTPDAFYRALSGPCSCGFTWPVCSRLLHLEAVDTLAACLEKTKRFSAAFSTALGLIRLSASSAIGYCRVSRIIRDVVRKNNEGPDQVVARSISALLRDAKLADIKELRDSLPLFVKCGLNKSDKYDKYYPVLRLMSHSLKLPESRKDPLAELPRELIGIIFSHLSTTDLIRCCRVNKAWLQTIEGDTILWSSITLRKPKTSKYFGRFLQRHKTVRNLSIIDISRLGLNVPKLATILRLQRLQQLCITGDGDLAAYSGEDIDQTTSHKLAPLEKLSFLIPSRPFPRGMELIFRTSATLQALEIGGGAAQWFCRVHPSMPNLKKLYLRLPPDRAGPSVRLAEIATCCPNLERLHLDQCFIEETEAVPTFKSLQSVSIGNGCRPAFTRPSRPPSLPTTLRVVEFMSQDSVLFELFLLERMTAPSNPPREFTNLEVLRCRYALSELQFAQLVEPSLRNGTLEVLELSMDCYDVTRNNLRGIRDPVKAYPNAASEHIHTVGLYDFDWQYANELTAEPLIEYLGRFPKATTVAAYPPLIRDRVLSFFKRLISHPGIKVIHQATLRGVEWDMAQEFAREKGVKLLHTPNHTPVGWPLGIEAR